MKGYSIILLLILSTHYSLAQPTNKYQKELVKELNEVLKHNLPMSFYYGYEGKFEIDSFFAVTNEGILSVTYKITNDTSYHRIRMTAPLNKIEYVDGDGGLSLSDNSVQIFVSSNEHTDWQKSNESSHRLWFERLPKEDKYADKRHEISKLIDMMNESSLNGTWIPIQQEFSGKELSKTVYEKQKLIIAEGNYTVIAESIDKGIVKYRRPKQLDIYGKEGVNADKHFTAIYKFENDELTICYNLAGNSYPETFETKDKPMYFLSIFKKEMKK